MPRQRGRSSAPARAPNRPTAAPAPARHAPPQQQSRGMTTTAAQPPATQQAPAQQGRSPGLFGQMASTAAGVAVGSSIGHAIGGFFGGGSSQAEQAPAAEAQVNASSYGDNYNDNSAGMARNCETDARAFTRCLDENKGEYQMSVCGWYLEQLKACQSAAKQY